MNSDSKRNSSNETHTPSGESKSESAAGGRQHAADYAPYPKIDPADAVPVANTWSSTRTGPVSGEPAMSAEVSSGYASATTMPPESNPYVSSQPAPSSTMKNNMDKVKDVLGKWGKKAAEATKKAEGLAGDMWQHLKTGPSMKDAAIGKISQSTKILAEGGYEKVFQNTFETVPEEKLLKTYGCYLSTSAGPVMGILYVSTAKVAFCSNDPLSYKVPDSEEPRWSYYKMVIPLNQLKAVNPSTSKTNPAEKYIQIISIDNHEFWFMGFVNYDSAVKNLLGAVQAHYS